MAKARATKATVVQGELVPAEPIKVVTDISVTTSDVMAIGMVEIETKLEAKIKDLATRMKAKEKEATEIQSKIDTIKTERVKEYFADAKKSLEQGFTLAKFENITVRTDVRGSIITDDIEKFDGVLSVNSKNCHYSMDRSQEFTANAAHQALTKEKCQTNLEVTKLREELVEAKLELSKLPSLERKYRAQLAKAQLSQSEQGRALLSQMQSSTESDLNRLRLTSK